MEFTADIGRGPEKCISAAEAGRELGISRQRIHQFIEDGRLRSGKAGTIRLVALDDVNTMRLKREAQA